jgi:hypothetical protein
MPRVGKTGSGLRVDAGPEPAAQDLGQLAAGQRVGQGAVQLPLADGAADNAGEGAQGRAVGTDLSETDVISNCKAEEGGAKRPCEAGVGLSARRSGRG